MAKKTFNIGECCAYGTIRILKTTAKTVTVALCRYKTKKVEIQETFDDSNKLFMWLTDATTSYYADTIAEEIRKAGVELSSGDRW